MVSDMPTISVRVSNEEKKELEKYGSLSNAVREGVKLYLQSKKTSKALAKRSEEHTSELQSQSNLVCRLLLEKNKNCMSPVTPTKHVSSFDRWPYSHWRMTIFTCYVTPRTTVCALLRCAQICALNHSHDHYDAHHVTGLVT